MTTEATITNHEPVPWMIQAFLQHDAMLSTLYFVAYDLPGLLWHLESKNIDLHEVVSITKARPADEQKPIQPEPIHA